MCGLFNLSRSAWEEKSFIFSISFFERVSVSSLSLSLSLSITQFFFLLSIFWSFPRVCIWWCVCVCVHMCICLFERVPELSACSILDGFTEVVWGFPLSLLLCVFVHVHICAWECVSVCVWSCGLRGNYGRFLPHWSERGAGALGIVSCPLPLFLSPFSFHPISPLSPPSLSLCPLSLSVFLPSLWRVCSGH